MRKDHIAIYLRLSKEDQSKVESNSISVQRMMLQNYVKEHFSEYVLMEFSDDGYTGTNFNRPGMRKMLELVKNSELDCIVVKDFSRFARDYIELGSYLEQIFPFLGVRFISVNDHYDSKDYKGSIADLDINFKNLLYDLYSKDLSQKVRSSLAIKKEKGEYVSANCPFGYDKAPNDRHMLLIEKDEAEIVRRIFALAIEGYTSTQTAKLFNQEKVMTPIEFKIKKGKTTRVSKGKNFLWSTSTICQILRNRIYAGDIVYGKYEKDFVGGKNHLKSCGEWKIFYNHHEPVIERKLFEKVQESRGRKRAMQYREQHLFVGKAVCGRCGRNLIYRHSLNPYFGCHQRYSNGLEDCVKHVNAMYLEQYVLFQMQEKMTENGEMEKLAQEYTRKVSDNIMELKENKQMVISEFARTKKEHFEEYQSYANGETESFHSKVKLMQTLQKEIQEISDEIDKVEDCYYNQKYNSKKLYQKDECAALTKDMIDRYIKRITIYDEQNIEIEWTFEP